MARTKGTPRSLPSLADAHRDIPAMLARTASTPARQQALLRATVPNEMSIPTDWNSERIKEAQKPQHQKDDEKMDRILDARLNGQLVSAEDLEWSRKYGEEVRALHEADNATISAVDSERGQLDYSDVDMWDDDLGGEQRETGTAPLTAGNLNKVGAVEDKEKDEETLSALLRDLSDVSDVSALNPERSPKKKRAVLAQPVNNDVEQEIAKLNAPQPDPRKSTLARALDTLAYDDNPSDRPHWLTGLRKPLPHADLTALQDFEVLTRFWTDDLTRLQHLRSKLGVPKDAGDGEWHYEHFGGTTEVNKRMGRGVKNVYARGVWQYMVDGECVKQQLDEFPLSLEGEPMGWGFSAKTHEEEGATMTDVSDYLVMEEPVEEEVEDRMGGVDDEDGVEELRREQEDFEMDDDSAWETVDEDEDEIMDLSDID